MLFRCRISGLVEPSKEVNQSATDSRNQLQVWVIIHASLRTLEKFFNDVCRCKTRVSGSGNTTKSSWMQDSAARVCIPSAFARVSFAFKSAGSASRGSSADADGICGFRCGIEVSFSPASGCPHGPRPCSRVSSAGLGSRQHLASARTSDFQRTPCWSVLVVTRYLLFSFSISLGTLQEHSARNSSRSEAQGKAHSAPRYVSDRARVVDPAPLQRCPPWPEARGQVHSAPRFVLVGAFVIRLA